MLLLNYYPADRLSGPPRKEGVDWKSQIEGEVGGKWNSLIQEVEEEGGRGEDGTASWQNRGEKSETNLTQNEFYRGCRLEQPYGISSPLLAVTGG